MMNMGAIPATLIVQLTSGLGTWGIARLVPKLRDTARAATIHLLLLIVLACMFFPRSWGAEELIGAARFLIFLAIQCGLYGAIWLIIFALL